MSGINNNALIYWLIANHRAHTLVVVVIDYYK